MTVQLLLLSATAFAAFACAQETQPNPELEIEMCSSLSCNDTESSGLCSGDGDREGRAIGVGLVPDFLPVSNSDSGSSLSLTLIDGEPSGAGFPYQFTTKSLLVGAPPGIDLRDQPPTCGLLMQYQGQTFPAYQSEALPNTTSCPVAFTGGADPFCLDRLEDTIQSFEYDNAQMLPRCEALAHYVEASIRAEAREYGFCFYYSALVSVGSRCRFRRSHRLTIVLRFTAVRSRVPVLVNRQMAPSLEEAVNPLNLKKLSCIMLYPPNKSYIRTRPSLSSPTWVDVPDSRRLSLSHMARTTAQIHRSRPPAFTYDLEKGLSCRSSMLISRTTRRQVVAKA